jgi:hypothetical protein
LGREMFSVGVRSDYKLNGSASRMFYDKRLGKLQGKSRKLVVGGCALRI